MKYELSDVIDSKFEHITRNLEQETRNLRNTYDELSSSLSVTNKELNNSFQDKVHTIKSMCATFFAKAEVQVAENVKKVDAIMVSHDKFVANFVNPAKEIDAKVFSMSQRIENCDRMRESQFSVVKDSVRKLIYALEAQNQGVFNSRKSVLGVMIDLASHSIEQDQHGSGHPLLRVAPGGAPGSPSEATSDLPRIYPVPSVQHLQELSVNLNSLSGEPSRQ